MADIQDPTYKVETVDGTERYICIVPDAGHDSGTCDFWARDEELLQVHMNQRHNGVMMQEEPEQEVEEDEDEPEGEAPAPSA